MRKNVIHGNGYECDICGKEVYPKDAIKVKSFVLGDSKGYYKIQDCIGVCKECYAETFKLLNGRGQFRPCHRKGEN